VMISVDIHSMTYTNDGEFNQKTWLEKIIGNKKKLPSIQIIKNFQIDIAENEKVSLIGSNGAGKTTLLRIMAGIEKAFQGSLTYQGEALVKPDKRIYLLHQRNTLLPWLTVKENLKFSSSKENRDQLEIVIEKFGLDSLINAFPKTLSGGEAARVALACAYSADPELLLLDEPFRGLDQLAVENCQLLLDEWLSGSNTLKAILLVSHSIREAINFSSRLIMVGMRPLQIVEEISLTEIDKENDFQQLLKIEKKVKSNLDSTFS